MKFRIGFAAFVIVVFLGTVLFALRTSEAPHTTEPLTASSTPPAVSLKDSYKKGAHTLTGSLTVPTPCHSVTASASFLPSEVPPTIRVDVDAPADDGLCLTLPTDKTFSLSVSAPQDVPTVVYVNGIPATIHSN